MNISKVFSRKIFFVFLSGVFSLFSTNVEAGRDFPDICLAANDGNLDRVKLLISQGEDVNARKDSNGLTPLMFAVLNGHLDIAEFLIKNEADIEANSHKTALGFTDNLEMAQLLIKNGANVNAKFMDYEENTPLLNAAENGWLDLVKLLIERGADINYENKDGNNALMLAADSGHLDVVKILVENGINLNKSGSFAMFFAADNHQVEIVEYLKKCGVKIDKFLITRFLRSAAINDSLYVLKLLIENGADVNFQDETGMSALMHAAKHGAFFAIVFLLKNGADINARCKKGLTALDYARNGLKETEEEEKEQLEKSNGEVKLFDFLGTYISCELNNFINSNFLYPSKEAYKKIIEMLAVAPGESQKNNEKK